MKMQDFFDLDTKNTSSTLQAHAVNLKTHTTEIDEHSKLITGDYEGIEFPVIFHQAYGKKLQDTLGTGWPSLYLISDRMKQCLEENQLTGWKTFPIKLYDKKGNEIFGYHGLSITGRSETTCFQKSEIIEKRLVPEGPICRYYKGIFFDNWDGSDFFIPKDTWHILLTKKAAYALVKRKITNLGLENLLDYEAQETDLPLFKRK